MSVAFGQRLARAVAARESNVVLGLDPAPARLWPDSHGAAGAGTAGQRLARAVLAHCRLLIDAVAPAVVAVKPQVACFERLGVPGRGVLGAVCEHARERGLLVIADAKRGDIDVSARAYAEAFLGVADTPWGPLDGLGADALTASPYMGADTLTSLLAVARPRERGIFVLVRTSNPGAADLQDLVCGPDGEPVWVRVARMVAALGLPGDAGALTDVGAVVGATEPGHLVRLRELMPCTPLLLPGVGTQGGRVEDLAAAWAPGRAGGLITASRSLVHAHETAGGPPDAAARAEAERLRAAAWALG
jgi:orotidine-5'-phosphate decarboxylase